MAQFIKFVFRKSDAALNKEKAKQKAVNKKKLVEFIGPAYAKNFSKDVDVLWDEVDYDHNGVLDKPECKAFLSELKKHMSADRAKNYDES
jgi:hypothetical protein